MVVTTQLTVRGGKEGREGLGHHTEDMEILDAAERSIAPSVAK